ncbi:PREDICTED: gamma-aminobutyric acid type B receptor subunit 2-like, partial [Amphimedon queenslandica]|uniref:Receptor ligand binding region domain-containing protein n=1 Tax=Amphimedon queenslandica TaxID=400682 RepID=A0AAN0IQV2_AMPQE
MQAAARKLAVMIIPWPHEHNPLASVSNFLYTEKTKSLYFGYITTLSGPLVLSGAIPVVDLALELINERDDVLQNYTLNYTDILDSKCDRTTSLDNFFQLINNDTTYVSLIGCGCSPATIPVAEISHYWNIPHLAYAAGADILNDRSRFKNFFRTILSFRYSGASLGQLMREFGWRQMAVITQDEILFRQVTESATNIFEDQGWKLNDFVVLSGGNPLSYFEKSNVKNFRIIHINAYPNFAYKILCEAYYRDMIGPMYLWIIPMWYNTGWWRTNSTSFSNNVSCTDEIMSKVIDGIIGIVPDGFLTLQNESLVTFSGL